MRVVLRNSLFNFYIFACFATPLLFGFATTAFIIHKEPIRVIATSFFGTLFMLALSVKVILEMIKELTIEDEKLSFTKFRNFTLKTYDLNPSQITSVSVSWTYINRTKLTLSTSEKVLTLDLNYFNQVAGILPEVHLDKNAPHDPNLKKAKAVGTIISETYKIPLLCKY